MYLVNERDYKKLGHLPDSLPKYKKEKQSKPYPVDRQNLVNSIKAVSKRRKKESFRRIRVT